MTFSTVAPLNPEKWMRYAQAFRNKSLVAMGIAWVKTDDLEDGDQVNFPYITDLRRQSYTVGTDLTFGDNVATQDSLIVDQKEVTPFSVDATQRRQARADFEAEYARQAVYQLNNGVDQAVLNSGVANALGSVTGGALNSGTIFGAVSDARAQLRRNNAGEGSEFLVVDPERAALIEQSGLANGFTVADSVFKNGFAGMFNGMMTYVSNNLPASVTLTLGTNPSNGQTLTVGGVVFTFVTNGTASNPGDISIGGSAAATQAIVVTAINGTGTPGASTYIDVSQNDRNLLANESFACSSFAANVGTITANNKIGLATTATNAVVGTETTSLLAGKTGAICVGMQITPQLYQAADSNTAGIITKYSGLQLYGVKTFERDKNRLAVISCNM